MFSGSYSNAKTIVLGRQGTFLLQNYMVMGTLHGASSKHDIVAEGQ